MNQENQILSNLVVFLSSLNGWSIKHFDGPYRITILWADPALDDQTNWCDAEKPKNMDITYYRGERRTPTAETIFKIMGWDVEQAQFMLK